MNASKITDYVSLMLAAREVVNVAMVVLSAVLLVLLARYILQQMRLTEYRHLEWPVKLSIGLFLIFLGEMMRSATAWLVLQTEGRRGTYFSDIIVIVGALLLIVAGSLCAIRVMTPAGPRSGWLWRAALALTILLAAINLMVLL